jgi:uncharacterized RDD family membrane protein YckC
MSAVIATEETLVIETPERVPLHFTLASIGNRFIACAIDHTIQAISIFLIFLLSTLFIGSIKDIEHAVESVQGAPKWILAVLIIIFFLIWFGYFIFFEWRWNGQTPGKRWLKLRVIREDGRPITFWEAAIRNLLRTLDMMPMVVVPFYSIGLVSVFISKRDQRVGDMFANTVVIREREAQAPSFDQVFSGSATTDAALHRLHPPVSFTGNVAMLMENEIEVVEIFLRRRLDLPEAPRQWMAWRVATPLLYKIQPTLDREKFSYEGFLEELLHQYREIHRFTD